MFSFFYEQYNYFLACFAYVKPWSETQNEYNCDCDTLWSENATLLFVEWRSQKYEAILIFGTRNPEEIRRERLCLFVHHTWKTLLRYLVKCRARSPLWSKLRCLHQKGDDFQNSRLLCCTATWTSDKQHHKIRYSSVFRSVMLDGHISRLMNGVSHGAEDRPCQERNALHGALSWWKTNIPSNAADHWQQLLHQHHFFVVLPVDL